MYLKMGIVTLLWLLGCYGTAIAETVESSIGNSGASIATIIEPVTSLSDQEISSSSISFGLPDDISTIPKLAKTLMTARTITIHVSELMTLRSTQSTSDRLISTTSLMSMPYNYPNATTITVPAMPPAVASISTSTSSQSSTSAFSSVSPTITTNVKKSAAIPSLDNPIKGMVDAVKWFISSSDSIKVTYVRSTSTDRLGSRAPDNEIANIYSVLIHRSGVFEEAPGGSLNDSRCYFEKWSSNGIAAWVVILHVTPTFFIGCFFYGLYLLNRPEYLH